MISNPREITNSLWRSILSVLIIPEWTRIPTIEGAPYYIAKGTWKLFLTCLKLHGPLTTEVPALSVTERSLQAIYPAPVPHSMCPLSRAYKAKIAFSHQRWRLRKAWWDMRTLISQYHRNEIPAVPKGEWSLHHSTETMLEKISQGLSRARPGLKACLSLKGLIQRKRLDRSLSITIMRKQELSA